MKKYRIYWNSNVFDDVSAGKVVTLASGAVRFFDANNEWFLQVGAGYAKIELLNE